jgi:tetratricopeptide (TPR) repeat protein
MQDADEELLRLLRAVKAHEPTGRANEEEEEQGDENDDFSLAYDDEDAVLLCLNALQAATEANAWRPSPHIAPLVDELLDWRIAALQLNRSAKTELLVVRWRFIGRAIETDAVGSDASLAARLLGAMAGDRFAALDVQYAVVECLTLAIDRRVIVIGDQALELLKQFYVTLARASVRQRLGAALTSLVTSKDDVKSLIHNGLPRAVVQVALAEDRALRAKEAIGEAQEDDAEEKLAKLIETAVGMLRHAATHACLKSDTQTHQSADTPSSLCDAVVQLMLSRVSAVFDESVRLLQMLVESKSFLSHLPSIPDLRGSLEKAHTLASKPENRPTVDDTYVRSLCLQLHELLVPQIDAYEKQHGSLVGLSEFFDHGSSLSADAALEAALVCKARGNTFYQRGNFATSRLFYRRAIAIVRAAEFQADQQLASLSISDLRQRCSVGASVQVVQRSGSLRSAMVSDTDEGDDTIEVLYDDNEGDEEERVPLSRVRLRMATQQLEQFKTVAVDCSMNMGKAFTMLFDYDNAIECFTHVLSIQPQYIAALYHRGVAHLVVHDLQHAQKDLWDANQLCGKWKTQGDAVETKKKSTLHAQIVAAYKKLQTLHATKKKGDKKLVKQMLGYLSSIPGLPSEDI